MRDQVDEQHTFNMLSNTYPLLYTPQVTPNQEVKRRRRRKKKNGGGDGEGMGKKRKLSDEQVSMLESSFGCEHKLESKRKDQLASELGLDPRQVAVWFQNRRARWKSKRLEEEYNKLRASHESTLLEKCSLENEMLKLKEQLEEAQREIRRLTMTERGEIGSSNSPSSSLTTMDVAAPYASVMQMQMQGEYNQLGGGGGGFQCGSPFYLEEDTCIPSYEWGLYSL